MWLTRGLLFKNTSIEDRALNIGNTVEPRYFELGYFEVPAISKEDRIPLDLPLCFQSFTISYFELGYFEFPAISNSYRSFPTP